MIIAPEVSFRCDHLESPRLTVANPRETPMELQVSFTSSSRTCSLIVQSDYAKRLSTLGFSNSQLTTSDGKSSRAGSTIPGTETGWPLNDRNDQAEFTH